MPHISRYCDAIAAIIHIARYFLREVRALPKLCDTPSWYLVSHRHICAIPHSATYRAIIVRYPPPPQKKKSTKQFCYTMATSTARCEKYFPLKTHENLKGAEKKRTLQNPLLDNRFSARRLLRSFGAPPNLGGWVIVVMDPLPENSLSKSQGGPGSVRFGYGSGVERFERFRFSVPAVPLQKGKFLCFSKQFNGKGRFRFRFRFLENGSGGSGSAFGFGGKTVPTVPVPVSECGWKSDWENLWVLVRSHSGNQSGEPTVLGDGW